MTNPLQERLIYLWQGNGECFAAVTSWEAADAVLRLCRGFISWEHHTDPDGLSVASHGTVYMP